MQENGSESTTLLHDSVIACDRDHIKHLIKQGADIYKRDFEGNTALHCAVGQGVGYIVRFLLKYQENIGLLNDDGDTALQLAQKIHNDSAFVINLLKQHGAK